MEQYLIVIDNSTKSGYRIISQYWEQYRDNEVYLIDTNIGERVITKERGEIKFYIYVRTAYSMKEATDWVHENKRGEDRF